MLYGDSLTGTLALGRKWRAVQGDLGVSGRSGPLVCGSPGGNLAGATSWGQALAGQGGEPPGHGGRASHGDPGHVGAGAVVGGQGAPLPEGGGACQVP